MKTTIKAIRVWHAERRFENPPRNAGHVWRSKSTFLLAVELESGVIGVGEGWVEQIDPARLTAFCDESIRPHLIGRDVLERAWVRQELAAGDDIDHRASVASSALSALDLALWDATGKSWGVSVYRLLGGSARRVWAYASGGLYAEGKCLADLAAEMKSYVARGFRGVKLKVGGVTLEEDVARVAAVREAIGPSIRLMVDNCFCGDLATATALWAAIQQYDIAFFEAPLPTTELAGWATLNHDRAIPLAGPELLRGMGVMRNFLERRAVSYLQFDPIIVGGITESLALAALARAWSVPVSLHHSNSAVALAVNAHLGAALGNCASVEVHMVHGDWLERLASKAWRLVDGNMEPSDQPGFGVAVPEELA